MMGQPDEDLPDIDVMLGIEFPRALDNDLIAISNCITLLEMKAKRLGL